MTLAITLMHAADGDWDRAIPALDAAYPELRAVWTAVDVLRAEVEHRDDSEIEDLRRDLKYADAAMADLSQRLAVIARLANVLAQMRAPDVGMVADLARMVGSAAECAAACVEGL